MTQPSASIPPSPPQPAVQKPRDPFFVQAAKFSLYVPLVLIALNIAILAGTSRSAPGGEADMIRWVKLMQGILSLAGVLAGLILGAVSLLGIPRYGASRILVRATAGILINGLFIICFIVVLLSPTRLSKARSHPIIDHSLPISAYVAKGVPPVDHPWRGADYRTAVIALERIATVDPHALPRWKSPASGELFNRITTEDNLKSLDAITDVRERLPPEVEIGVVIDPLTKIYIAAARKGASEDEEIVELSRFALQLANRIDADMDGFLATLPRDNPRYDQVAQQFQSARANYLTVAWGTLDILQDKSMLKNSQTRFARYLCPLLPPLLKHLPRERTSAFLHEIKSVYDAQPASDYKTALAELQAAIEPIIK